MSQIKEELAGAGASNTAALAFGGDEPIGYTELWNGTNWTEVNNMNNVRDRLAGAGTNTAALAFGGNPGPKTALTETWNGTNWTEVNDMAVGKEGPGGAGTNTAALAFGGASSATEEWNVGPQTVTFTNS